MFDLVSAFEDFPPVLDVQEMPIDGAFITDFLAPYFNSLPREQLAAKVEEVIALELARHVVGKRPH